MANGVFIHREDSIYRDTPSERYHFPKSYLSRAEKCVGDWILYYEPVKVRNTKGYWAVAKVAAIVPDPEDQNMFYAMIEPGEFVQFGSNVPFTIDGAVVEQGLLNDVGILSGRAQSAVRPLNREDFVRIVKLGLTAEDDLLPRTAWYSENGLLREDRVAFEYGERERVPQLSSRVARDRAFRRTVLRAYDERCTLTGLKLINGGGRAEVEAAHIRPVAANGPDIVTNGLALSGTVHWMFDRGLVSVADDLTILVSRHVNDRDGVTSLLNRDGRARLPSNPSERPHPHFLEWHRQNCFKN
ncbi:HNH endonuclease [Sphingomonas sp. AX6]|uniref:HNH endonuclease n=1 Tax=Sphingomonas sp. AX6 TaxID=2653171 RepID=UPI0012F1297F|nr:HNH endonuclease [Sphingomonas sp. AX6]VXC55386.1 Putative restriction endonuclease [Sphingomonas sp. AX6]